MCLHTQTIQTEEAVYGSEYFYSSHSDWLLELVTFFKGLFLKVAKLVQCIIFPKSRIYWKKYEV